MAGAPTAEFESRHPVSNTHHKAGIDGVKVHDFLPPSSRSPDSDADMLKVLVTHCQRQNVAYSRPSHRDLRSTVYQAFILLGFHTSKTLARSPPQSTRRANAF